MIPTGKIFQKYLADVAVTSNGSLSIEEATAKLSAAGRMKDVTVICTLLFRDNQPYKTIMQSNFLLKENYIEFLKGSSFEIGEVVLDKILEQSDIAIEITAYGSFKYQMHDTITALYHFFNS